MKLSERLYKTADDFDKSESIWERRMPWRKLADEVAQLEAHVEELDGYWQFEIAQRNKAEAKNEKLREAGQYAIDTMGQKVGLAPLIDALKESE